MDGNTVCYNLVRCFTLFFPAEKARLSEELRAARETAKKNASDDKEKALHDKLIKVGTLCPHEVGNTCFGFLIGQVVRAWFEAFRVLLREPDGRVGRLDVLPIKVQRPTLLS